MSNEPLTTSDERWPQLPARPWKFLGCGRETYQAIPGDPNCPVQPGTSCDLCGEAISNVAYFQAMKTGERFKIGCVCVYKMFKAMAEPTNSLKAAEREIRKEKNRQARERAAKKRLGDKERAKELLETHRETLAAHPHPSEWRAQKGDTLADWITWMLRNGGGPATKKVLKKIEEVAGTST